MYRFRKDKKKSKTKSRSRNNIGVKLIEKPEYYDYNLVAAIILLTCFGLVMLYSTSAYTSTIKYGDDMYFFKKQAAISFVCIAGALFIPCLIIISWQGLQGFCMVCCRL